MKYRHFKSYSLMFATALTLTACGGGSSDELSVSDVETVNGTFDALEGLLSTINETAVTSKLSSRAQTTTSKGSLAGCQNNQEVKRMIDNLREVSVNVCAVGAMQKTGKVTLPNDGSFAYGLMKFPNEPGDSASDDAFETRVRVRNYTNTEGQKCLQLDRCEPNKDLVFTQVHSFEACETSKDGLKGITAKNRGSNDGGDGWLSINAYGSGKGENVDLKFLDIEAAFDDSWGSGNGRLSADKESSRIDMNWLSENTFTDNRMRDFTNTFAMCSVSGKGEGAVNFSGTMEVPSYQDPNNSSLYYCPRQPGQYNEAPVTSSDGAICPFTFSHTEAFKVEKNQDDLKFSVVDPANTSLWYSDLKESCAPTVVEIPQAYFNAWNCEAETAGFTEIDIAADTKLIDLFKPCFDKGDKSEFEDGHQSCDQQYSSGNF